MARQPTELHVLVQRRIVHTSSTDSSVAEVVYVQHCCTHYYAIVRTYRAWRANSYAQLRQPPSVLRHRGTTTVDHVVALRYFLFTLRRNTVLARVACFRLFLERCGTVCTRVVQKVGSARVPIALCMDF